MWKTTGLQIGSNIQPPMVRSMSEPAAAVAAAPAMTVERLGDLLGVFLFQVLRIGDRAYQEGLEGLPVLFDALATAAEHNHSKTDLDDQDDDLRGTNGYSTMNGYSTINGYSTVNGNTPRGSLTS